MVDMASTSVLTFAATLTGVFVGQALAIVYDLRRQQRSTFERRSRATTSMRNELSRMTRELDEYRDGEHERVVYPTAAYRSSVASGSFALLDAEVQDRVSTVYGVAEAAAERQRDLQAAARAGEADPGTLRELRRALARRHDELRPALSEARKALREQR